MTPAPRCIKDSLLECYLVDALSPDARARVEAQLATSPADQERLEELRADSAAFLALHPAGPLVARFEAEHPQESKWWQWLRVAVPAIPALLMLAMHTVEWFLLQHAPPPQAAAYEMHHSGLPRLATGPPEQMGDAGPTSVPDAMLASSPAKVVFRPPLSERALSQYCYSKSTQQQLRPGDLVTVGSEVSCVYVCEDPLGNLRNRSQTFLIEEGQIQIWPCP